MKIILITNLITFCVTVVATLYAKYANKRIRRHLRRKSQEHKNEHIGVKTVSVSRKNTSNLQTPVSSKTHEEKPVNTDSNRQPLNNEIQTTQRPLSRNNNKERGKSKKTGGNQKNVKQRQKQEEEGISIPKLPSLQTSSTRNLLYQKVV